MNPKADWAAAGWIEGDADTGAAGRSPGEQVAAEPVTDGSKADGSTADELVVLPAELVDGLTDALKVTLSTDLVAEDLYPYGARDYTARFTLEYELFPDAPEEALEAAAVLRFAQQLGLPSQGRSVSIPVGYAQVCVVDCVNGSFDALDARGSDEARLGGVLFFGGADGTGLQDELGAFDDFALLVNFATIKPAFRGHGLSVTALGLVMDELSRGCMCALLDPMLPGADGDTARAEARAGLSRHWAKLGFVDYGDTGLMLLDFDRERPPLIPTH